MFQIVLQRELEAAPGFWERPIDVVAFDFLIWFGWIPILVTLVWGFIKVWQSYRQDQYTMSLKYMLLSIDVPRMTEQSPMAMENVFATLQGAFGNLTWKEKWILGKYQPRWSFEIVSIDGYIQFYIRTETRWRDVLEAGIYAQYPDAQIQEAQDYVDIVPTDYPNEEWDMWGAELALKKDSYFPIRTWESFEHSMTQELKDPLGVILEQMSRMKPGECFWFQLMVNVCDQDWKEKGLAFIKKIYGIKEAKKKSGIDEALSTLLSIPSEVSEQLTGVSLLGAMGLASAPAPKDEDQWKAFKITLQEKAQVEGVTQKISKLGMKYKIRLLYFGRKGVYDKRARTAMVKGMLQQYTHQDLNAFGLYGPQVPKDDYFWQTWSYTEKQSRLTKAYKKRSFSVGATPKILNVEELATLWHFPAINVKAPLVKKTESRRAEPPVGLPIAMEDAVPSRHATNVPAQKPAKLETKGQTSVAPESSAPAPMQVSLPDRESFAPRPTPPTPATPAAAPATPQTPTPLVPTPMAPGRRQMPEAMRVMLEPGVELEDVKLSQEDTGKPDEGAPPNLPT